MNELNQKISDTKQLLSSSQNEIKKYLKSMNLLESTEVSGLMIYKWFIVKEIIMYKALNNFKAGESLLIGLFWAPDSEIRNIYSKINDIKEDRNLMGPQIWKRENHSVVPPTYFRLNEFTAPFQEITNTYGVPNYKEANPSMFGIITFPFLFGVMFGDIGHGGLLLIFGIILCLMTETMKQTPVAALVQARYMILMMGFFATFNGVCYNDFMSIPLEVKTCYHTETAGEKSYGVLEKDCIMPIGIDPYWYLAQNQLTYVNNLKMKISVIFGVTQMSLGIFVKALNAIHFGKVVDILFEFLPQITLLMCLFGFMDLLIIIKWLQPWTERNNPQTDPPSIITIMINMFLNQGKLEKGTEPLIIDEDIQKYVCILLVLVALICIPLML